MKKIPTLFVRDEITKRVVNIVRPECVWVNAGEGVATRKWDGTACMVRDGKLFRRHSMKKGKNIPKDFEPAQEPAADGYCPGWVPVGDGTETQWHREAWKNTHGIFSNPGQTLSDGTYELVGPKILENPEKLEKHILIAHGIHKVDAPRTYDELRKWLQNQDLEGVVWYHPDGRMVKIKAKDFGIVRKQQKKVDKKQGS